MAIVFDFASIAAARKKLGGSGRTFSPMGKGLTPCLRHDPDRSSKPVQGTLALDLLPFPQHLRRKYMFTDDN